MAVTTANKSVCGIERRNTIEAWVKGFGMPGPDGGLDRHCLFIFPSLFMSYRALLFTFFSSIWVETWSNAQ